MKYTIPVFRDLRERYDVEVDEECHQDAIRAAIEIAEHDPGGFDLDEIYPPYVWH